MNLRMGSALMRQTREGDTQTQRTANHMTLGVIILSQDNILQPFEVSGKDIVTLESKKEEEGLVLRLSNSTFKYLNILSPQLMNCNPLPALIDLCNTQGAATIDFCDTS